MNGELTEREGRVAAEGRGGASEQRAPDEAELATVEMFADLVRDALLTHYDGKVRPVHRVAVGRLLRGGSAVALLAAVDAARKMAAYGESHTAVRHAFILALAEREVAPGHRETAADLAAREAEAAEQKQEVGPDAFLLYRMADDRAALATEAAGIDLAAEAEASADASSLRALAVRHAVHYARRDVSGKEPWVERGATVESQRSGGAE